MITLAERIKDAGLTFTIEDRYSFNEIEMRRMEQDAQARKWYESAALYTAIIAHPTKSYLEVTVDLAYGPAAGEPTLENTLRNLLDDAATWFNANSFAEWCDDLGFDEDSRTAEMIYDAVEKQTDQLRDFLYSLNENYIDWMFDTDMNEEI